MYQSQGQGLASLGRGQDSMLVHMTPGEVQGLQKLAMSAGGSLTINPQTGLPEAGILSSLLPMALGFALGPAGLGLATSSLGAAAMVGGLGALATGSLSKGLMYGLGAYGGSELAGGLQAAGADQAAKLAANEAAINGSNIAQANIGSTGNAAVDEFMKQQAAQQTSAANAFGLGEGATFNPSQSYLGAEEIGDYGTLTQQAMPQQISQDVLQKAAQQDVANYSAPSTPVMPEAYSRATQEALARSPFQNSMQGIKELTGQGTGTASDAFNRLIGDAADKKTGAPATGLGGFGGAAKTVGMAAAPLIPELMKPNTLGIAGMSQKQSFGPTDDFSQTVNPLFGQPGQPYYSYQGYTKRVAQGGAIGYAEGGIMASERPFQSMSLVSLWTLAHGKTKAGDTAKQELEARRNLGEDINPEADPYVGMAGGGLMNFSGGTYAAGGKLLRGAGDGMSDSIPAVIGGANPQRAALADGEFVIPADVVSHLGNGSTEAGSRHLYSMMDKVRKARTGNPKQGKQINPDRFMPA